MIPWAAIERAGFQAAVLGVERGLDRIVATAKELAPVRKVFGQYEKPYSVRLKTVSEIRADKNVRKALGLGPENAYVQPPTIVSRRASQHLSDRRLRQPIDRYTGRRLMNIERYQGPTDFDELDRRGKYEIRTLRAEHHTSVGGRLRSEIHALPVTVSGKKIMGRVVSPTPYAKYQELGTRHNPAHPYMRPAGHRNRTPIALDIGRSVAAATRPLFRGRMDVVVHTRAR